MSDQNETIEKLQNALTALRGLQGAAAAQNQAEKEGEIVGKIDALTICLGKLRRIAIRQDDQEIVRLNASLDQVTADAKKKQDDLDHIATVLNKVVAVVNLVDQIVELAT